LLCHTVPQTNVVQCDVTVPGHSMSNEPKKWKSQPIISDFPHIS